MARTALLGSLAATVLAWSWLHLEHGPVTRSLVVWTALVGIAPALLTRRSYRLAAVPPAVLLGVHYALGTVSPREAWSRFTDGFFRYYDIALPFGAESHPRMHSLVVIAILGFTLAVSLAVAERRALLAAGLLVAGAAWPATLLTSSNTLARGAIILAAALAVIGGLSAAVRVQQAAVAAAVVVAAAVGLAGIPAVAKGAFVAWETWEPSRDEFPVSVRYVWETSYNPLTWPAKKTTVFTVEAPPVSRYWRATTLDEFNEDVWLVSTPLTETEPVVDPLLPAAAYRPDRQVRAEIKIEALQDQNLIGASVPVRFDVGDLEPVLYQHGGGAFVPQGVPRGTTYTAWSYTARPSPAQLARSAAVYGRDLQPYLVVQSRYDAPPMPAFGLERRDEAVERIFAENPRLDEYRPLYDEAVEVAGNAPSPYAAVVALESYFRDGDFSYDEDPERGDPELVEFVTRTRRGYCQYFAGAMTLMLRYLGIPARVGAGFTSGSYDQEDGRWTVTDRDAHTWVEVWFRGFGWLPFDPTPGRGELDGAYSAASINFNPAAVAAALAALGANPAEIKLNEGRAERAGPSGRDAPGRDLPGDIGARGSDREGSLLRLLALVAAALAGGIALLKLALRRTRFLTRDPRKVAAACRRELAEFLTDQRVDVPDSATLGDVAELLRTEAGLNAERFVAAVDAARYGTPAAADEAARRARRELRRLERAFRQQLSTWDRARGLVSTRSLGLA